MAKLLKYLYNVAKHNGLGNIPDHVLVKALESYKINDDSFSSEDIEKSVLPGTIKIVHGTTFIYTATPNAKTDYDWRVYLSNGSTVSSAGVNEMFPKGLSEFKFVKKLGGSTGAELHKDSYGNEYVLKNGKNTSNAHVESEYIANQLYELLGVRTPDYELYENSNGEKVLASKFIHNTKTVSASDYGELSKNFIVDAFLANWDVYLNDNCLKDPSGRIYRVDNGGSLSFSATGRSKTFGDNVDLDGMIKHNGHIVSNLTDQDFINQINDLLSKKDNLISFLKLSNQKSLVSTFENRFDSMKKIASQLENKVNRKQSMKNKPRKLLSDADMYKEFDDVELTSIWSSVSGNWRDKIMSTASNGWELLENICKLRGFDARPEVVSEVEYWKNVNQTPTNQVFRGVEGDRTKSADELVDEFNYNDNCFFSTVGIYGSGIYFHMNDNPNASQHSISDYKQSGAYKHAKNYGSGVVHGFLSPKAKIISNKDLIKELQSNLIYDVAAAKEIQDKIDIIDTEIKDRETKLSNITQNTVDSVKTDMHWDDNVYVMFPVEIDDVDWGDKDDEGRPNYPSFDDFFHGKVEGWVKANGGTITEKVPNSGDFVLKMPNSKETFLFSKYSYENNAIKQKNAFTKAYSYPVKRFQDWFVNNHYNIIQKEVDKKISNLGDEITNLKKDISEKHVELRREEKELHDLKNKKVSDPNKDVVSACIHAQQEGYDQALGVYAALRGYDAIKVHNGNGMGNSFLVVLNRSKIITKES